MADLPTTATVAGTAATVGSFIFNVFLSFVVAYQAKQGTKLADSKAKTESELAKSTSGDMIRAQESLLSASRATAEAWEKSAHEWQGQHEKLSVIHEASRDDWHKRNDAANLIVLRLTEENGILKSQTNLQPIMDSLERIVKSQEQLSAVLLGLCRKLNIDCEAEVHREADRENAA